jgi:hypothetical protein
VLVDHLLPKALVPAGACLWPIAGRTPSQSSATP